MKILILFTSTFLTWAAFDRNLFRRRADSYATNASEISFELGADELRQKKKIQQKYLNVIPARYRKRPARLRMKCNYFGSKSRDSRDSDQRKIRRRFNNM